MELTCFCCNRSLLKTFNWKLLSLEVEKLTRKQKFFSSLPLSFLKKKSIFLTFDRVLKQLKKKKSSFVSTVVVSYCLLLLERAATFTSRSALRMTSLKLIMDRISKPQSKTVAILVVCASPQNTKEAHEFLLTQTMCTYSAKLIQQK